MQQRRNFLGFLKNALAVLVGLAASLVLAELSLRLVARFHAPVRYLVTVGDAAKQPVFENLRAYLASHPELVPHSDFLNHWTNAFGLNDLEFVSPKPPGRFRLLALGDSFTYGLVPYPDAVMTRLEEILRTACTGVDLDLLNFGIGGIGVWDYKTLFELVDPTFDPDLVLVNFYLGNDGPDPFDRPARFRGIPPSLRGFYLARYVTNWVRLATSLEQRGAIGTPTRRAASSSGARGGGMVSPSPLPPNDGRLIGPTFSEETFLDVMSGEFRRIVRPPEASAVQRTWHSTLSILDVLHHQVTLRNRRLVIALYPSVVQVYPETRKWLMEQIQLRPRFSTVRQFELDPMFPNRVMLEYCRAAGLDCYDVTPDLVAASAQSLEPLYKARDTHWTVRGNLVAAEAQARWLQPLVCPERPAARGADTP